MSKIPNEIPNVLACDVGNSRIRFARVQGEKVEHIQQFRVGQLAGLGEAIAELRREIPPPRKLVAGSVNPPALKALEAAVADVLDAKVLVIGRDLPIPIETRIEHPESIGVDRLCCAAAAYDRIGRACVVADFGTAVTIDCVSEEGEFLGGAILPGLAMGAECLHAGTAQLPKVQLADPTWVFGTDTRKAILTGLVHGARGALRELVEAYATEIGHWPIVILTGGDAELICNRPSDSELVQAIVPDLSLRGVAAAYYRSLVV